MPIYISLSYYDKRVYKVICGFGILFWPSRSDLLCYILTSKVSWMVGRKNYFHVEIDRERENKIK